MVHIVRRVIQGGAGPSSVDRRILAEARRIGHVVRVIRRKNPAPSRVVYQDALQVALLSRKEDTGGA